MLRGSVVAVLVLLALPLSAHHSAGMFDFLAPVWVRGTVVSYERVNPHSMMTVKETREDGRTIEWTVEGPSVFQLDRGTRLGLDAGDVVEVCGFALKDEFSSRRPRSFIHGHLLAMPNGEKRRWGPYGVPAECLSRLEDEDASGWMTVLNTEKWCRQSANRDRLSPAAQTFLEEFVDQNCNQMSVPGRE